MEKNENLTKEFCFEVDDALKRTNITYRQKTFIPNLEGKLLHLNNAYQIVSQSQNFHLQQ